MNRRNVLTLIVGGASVATLGSQLVKAKVPSRASRKTIPVIDANLSAPIDGDTRLDAETIALVRSSGLTAIKTTLGDSGNKNKAQTEAQIADLKKAISINGDVFMQVENYEDLANAARSRRVGIILSFEAAEMLEGRLESIDHFRAAGVLVMGLSYNVATPFASGTMAPNSTGLTLLGREAVSRMNETGVTIDVSHSDEHSSMGALTASTKPILITHAGCAAIHPHPRNKSDALLRALAQRGGVIGIYELSFLVPPPAQPHLPDYLDHVSHALKVCGEDHVGIGTDGLLTPFPTTPEYLSAWTAEVERRKAVGVGAPGEGPPPFVIGLNRADRFAVIADGLKQRGYRSPTIDKVLGTNLARVFRETWI